jgi:hypothetical protein
MPDGSVVVGEHLIVLADTVPAGDGGYRVVPLRVRVPGGQELSYLLERPAEDTAMVGVLQETVVRMLHAAGVRVTAVDIEPTGEDVTELRAETVTTRVGLSTAAGPRDVVVGAGYGLALAVAAGAPVRVADEMMDRFAVPVEGEDLLAPFVSAAAARPAPGPVRRWRFEPRNMTFADGLDWWELAGSFLGAGRPHWQDYSCTAADRSAVLASAVPDPSGSAVLFQTIYADDYRGHPITFRGQLRSTGVTGQAGLYLAAGRALDPPGAHLRDRGVSSVTGSASVTGAGGDWTWHEVTTPVPAEAGVIRFGVFLTGRGRIQLRDAEIAPARPERAELRQAWTSRTATWSGWLATVIRQRSGCWSSGTSRRPAPARPGSASSRTTSTTPCRTRSCRRSSHWTGCVTLTGSPAGWAASLPMSAAPSGAAHRLPCSATGQRICTPRRAAACRRPRTWTGPTCSAARWRPCHPGSGRGYHPSRRRPGPRGHHRGAAGRR